MLKMFWQALTSRIRRTLPTTPIAVDFLHHTHAVQIRHMLQMLAVKLIILVFFISLRAFLPTYFQYVRIARFAEIKLGPPFSGVSVTRLPSFC